MYTYICLGIYKLTLSGAYLTQQQVLFSLFTILSNCLNSNLGIYAQSVCLLICVIKLLRGAAWPDYP